MSVLAQIYQDIQNQQIQLFVYPIGFCEAVSMRMDGKYAVFLDFKKIDSIRSYTEILAHECGHCATGALHRVSSPYDLVEKHEFKANRWAFERYLPFEKLETAMREGCTQLWQLAEYFGFPEEFICKAVRYYTENRGLHFTPYAI